MEVNNKSYRPTSIPTHMKNDNPSASEKVSVRAPTEKPSDLENDQNDAGDLSFVSIESHMEDIIDIDLN